VNDNQIISEARGHKCYNGILMSKCYPAGKADECESGCLGYLNYSGSTAPWNEDIYAWIDKMDLWRKFTQHLGRLVCNKETMPDDYKKGEAYMIDRAAWLVIKATPAQKASALAKSIKESK
jgi:hypothetical protein